MSGGDTRQENGLEGDTAGEEYIVTSQDPTTARLGKTNKGGGIMLVEVVLYGTSGRLRHELIFKSEDDSNLAP